MKSVEETRTTNEKCCSRRLGGKRQPQQRTQQLLINIFAFISCWTLWITCENTRSSFLRSISNRTATNWLASTPITMRGDERKHLIFSGFSLNCHRWRRCFVWHSLQRHRASVNIFQNVVHLIDSIQWVAIHFHWTISSCIMAAVIFVQPHEFVFIFISISRQPKYDTPFIVHYRVPSLLPRARNGYLRLQKTNIQNIRQTDMHQQSWMFVAQLQALEHLSTSLVRNSKCSHSLSLSPRLAAASTRSK